MKKESKITKEMPVAKILSEYPNVASVLLDYGLHCIGCAASSFETIEEGAKVHGLTNESISEMIKKMNSMLELKK